MSSLNLRVERYLTWKSLDLKDFLGLRALLFSRNGPGFTGCLLSQVCTYTCTYSMHTDPQPVCAEWITGLWSQKYPGPFIDQLVNFGKFLTSLRFSFLICKVQINHLSHRILWRENGIMKAINKWQLLLWLCLWMNTELSNKKQYIAVWFSKSLMRSHFVWHRNTGW